MASLLTCPVCREPMRRNEAACWYVCPNGHRLSDLDLANTEPNPHKRKLTDRGGNVLTEDE